MEDDRKALQFAMNLSLAIGVLFGGPSAEREISIQSGEAVTRALAEAGWLAHPILVDETFNVTIARSLDIEVAFLALHGEFG